MYEPRLIKERKSSLSKPQEPGQTDPSVRDPAARVRSTSSLPKYTQAHAHVTESYVFGGAGRGGEGLAERVTVAR